MEQEIIASGGDEDEKKKIRNILHLSTLPAPWNKKINLFSTQEKSGKNKKGIIELIGDIRAQRTELLNKGLYSEWIDNIIEGLSTDVARLAKFADTKLSTKDDTDETKKERKEDDGGLFSKAMFPSNMQDFSVGKIEKENDNNEEKFATKKIIIIGDSAEDDLETSSRMRISDDEKKISSTKIESPPKTEIEEVSDFDDLLPSSSNVHYYSTGECYPK